VRSDKPLSTRPFRDHLWGCLVFAAMCIFTLSASCLAADSSRGSEVSLSELEKLRLQLVKQQAKLKQEEESIKRQESEIDEQRIHLSSQSRLLDKELRKIRAAGATASSAIGPAPDTAVEPAQITDQPTEVTQSVPAEQPAPVAQSSPPEQPAQAPPESAPITGPPQKEQEARRVVQAAPVLANSGGVLTPKNELVIDPSFEYDYWNQNQLALNGFEIIPGITFGNIFISKEQQNILTAAVTARYGVTDRLELNIKIPYVYNYTDWTAQEAGPNAQFLFTDASNEALGDIQFGASYQINSGENGWPIFVGNLIVKTATGVSPFSVPIITVNDPNGQFLEGIPKKTPTGTGFWAIEPSVTALYPSAPGVWFANLQYIYNVPAHVGVQSTAGDTPIGENLAPGGAIAATFGFGFAVNDRMSLTLSYQQEHNFASTENGATIPGSSYDFGTFNFGMGYVISKKVSLNLGVGIGAGPNAPAAKILLEVPIRFDL
jgi:hypothetical protein